MKILRERAAAVFPKPQGKRGRFQRYLQVRESKQHKKSTNRQKNLKKHTTMAIKVKARQGDILSVIVALGGLGAASYHIPMHRTGKSKVCDNRLSYAIMIILSNILPVPISIIAIPLNSDLSDCYHITAAHLDIPCRFFGVVHNIYFQQ
jgi:hypothetical protein